MLNGDKTDSQILTYHQNCDPGLEYQEMMDTKRAIGKLDGRQCYHIIQSFKPGEVTPELALEIAKEFTSEYLPDYEVVIGTHVDKKHIHSHLIFNSVNAQTGKKYHISNREYYSQIRAISDRLCTVIDCTPYKPFKKHPHYTGFMALYVHYLYVLGKVEKRQYPPRMTPRLRKEVMRFEQYRKQFMFLRENNIVSQEDMNAFQSHVEDELANFMKKRTILNVRKKKRKGLYDALADVAALAQAKALYEEGLSGMETEFSQYMEAGTVLAQCGVPRGQLSAEKAAIYEQLAQINADIRAARRKLALCKEIQDRLPQMERTIEKMESREIENHEKHRGR